VNVARILATWFGCGHSPVAPGTVGTLGALPLAYGLHVLGPVAYWAGTLAAVAGGTWAADRTARELGVEDPQVVVIDEVAGVLIAIGIAAAGGPWAAAAAILLFRLFDVWKPGPVDRVQKLPGGLGIMADDVLAGLLAGALAFGGALLAQR
jgi:phosphatidylglycerophosphatase A